MLEAMIVDDVTLASMSAAGVGLIIGVVSRRIDNGVSLMDGVAMPASFSRVGVSDPDGVPESSSTTTADWPLPLQRGALEEVQLRS